MKTLIVLANQNENSTSKAMMTEFLKSYSERDIGKIKILDLYEEGIDFLYKSDLESINNGEDNIAKSYAEDFLTYDKILFVYPFWNLGIPAILKAYMDYITYSGVTFTYTPEGPKGLLNNPKVAILMSSGGVYGDVPFLRNDETYLSSLMTFLGAHYTAGVRCEGADIPGLRDAAIAGALKESFIFGQTF